jgi:hypothetical protein
MNVNILIVLLSLICRGNSADNIYNNQLKYFGSKLRNSRLRMIIHKKKYNPELCKKIKKINEFIYENSITKINKLIYEYNTLSEDDKFLIESLITICL